MYNIAIVDDHTLFRQGISALLSEQTIFKVDGSFDTGSSFLKAMKEQNFDIVLLDISLPDISGFEVMKLVKKSHKNLRVIMLSMHNDIAYISKSIKLGAYAYLLKNVSEKILIDTINEVINGQKVFDKTQMDNALSVIVLEGEITKPSKREQEVLALVAEGHTTKEIANRLFVSVRTIETHRNNLMRKFQVQNTAELISKALKIKMI